MTAKSHPPECPRCGETNVSLCGRSVQYAPENHPQQPLAERERITLAFQCQCGLAFTQTTSGDTPNA